MRFAASAAIMLALTAGPSVGDDFLRFFPKRPPRSPNHLVPMQSFMNGLHQDYYQLLVEHLFATEGRLGRMVGRPRFSAEFCLSVDVEQVEQADAEAAGDRYTITLTCPVESIWLASSKARQDRNPIHVKTERRERQIGRDLAVAIQRVWARALLLARHSETTERDWEPPSVEANEPLHGFWGAARDRSTYNFSVFVDGLGILEGQTQSPERGVPLELTNIGLDLVAFARSHGKGKEITEAQLTDRLRKLESAIMER